MLLLRLTQHAESTPGRYRIEVSLEDDGAQHTAAAPLEFALSPQDQEDLRWYFEDYLQFPIDPAPRIAARIEARMAEIGDTLFRAVFHADDAARDLWALLRARSNEPGRDLRAEVRTDPRHAAAVPWELMRDPVTKVPLALRARAFVRAHTTAPARPRTHAAAGADGAGPVRILLVICRPAGGADVPFRSVASRLLRGLDEASREVVELTVLRPPTFAQLGKALRRAHERGRPYHVVHFDGHGAYLDAADVDAAALVAGVSPLVLQGRPTARAARAGKHGYLVFEPDHPAAGAATDAADLVDGPTLGALLAETGVPFLMLNACRSAYADPPPAPVAQDAAAPATSAQPGARADIAGFGSLALELMEAGVTGVLAMRYNVYVATAAQLVAHTYGALADGLSLGEAVTRGRKQLHDQPLRDIAFGPTRLFDWPVPVVYEAKAIPLFPPPPSTRALHFTTGKDASPARGTLSGVPERPDAGFFGRDETLLRLDRAFDRHSVVLLHAYAGSGKSAAAAEFARWYSETRGLDGPVLWQSFEQKRTLPQVLEALAQVFEPVLAQKGIPWLALPEEQRKQVALQLLKQVPVLWIWDNVELVAGFPAGTPSAWTADEQHDLAAFLRAARETQAKFLLTSRREERPWLGDLPVRVEVPPMPLQERVQLASALADRRGARLGDVKDWRPLLDFTQGNPLTITVLVGQALRDGLRGAAAVQAFVDRLRAGQAAFEDEQAEGRSKSLGASLSYGFEHAFQETERAQLALLHLFQGFVDVDVLKWMGHSEKDWCLATVRGLTRETATGLLDRAAEIGLLQPRGGGGYSIHPALPWYFRSLFDKHYPVAPAEGTLDATAATRAFVEAMGQLGDVYCGRYQEGRRDVVAALQAEEPNLLHARGLARRHAWWSPVIGAMQGLSSLYDHTGRRLAWARLVDEIVPDFVDAAAGGPLPGREEHWSLITSYRVRLAMVARQFEAAERLQQVCVDWLRTRALATLAAPPETLDAAQQNAIRTLATSVFQLGQIQRESNQASCIPSYEEGAGYARRIGDGAGEAAVAFNLGHAYKDLPSMRDLVQAEHWYRQSLNLYTEDQRHDRAQCLITLGHVSLERFQEARGAGRPDEELLRLLNAALDFYRQALDLLPANAVDDLAITHNSMGNVYSEAGDVPRALQHYQQAIRYFEQADDLFRAGGTRFNTAVLLLGAGRFADARAYADAALRNFETFGDRAADMIQQTQQLLAYIDKALSTPSRP